MVALGGFILWFGWFGFNAGSTLAANLDIGKIVLNTHLAACAGAVGYMLAAKFLNQAILLTRTVNGSLGGLVGITAGCASMDPQFAIATGLLAGILATVGSQMLAALKVDDVVDAVSVHGLCGAWGTIAAGMFYAGDLFDMARIGVQTLGVVVAFIWGFGIAFTLYYLLDITIGMKASPLHQQRGLDITEYAEIGYPEFQNTTALNQETIYSSR